MHFNVLSLFPELISQSLSYGVVGQALFKETLTVDTLNPRDYAQNKHKSVDDRPYGGGDGMIMMAPVLEQCLIKAQEKTPNAKVVYLSPQGRMWNDSMARSVAKNNESVTLICGRYGGVDQRFIESYVDEEWSIGDFILSGGEFAALAIIDSIARHLPGVLGHPQSATDESFGQTGLLEHPQFTRPIDFNGMTIPETLTSGHHKNILAWQKNMSILKTVQKRPELINQDQAKEVKASISWAMNLTAEELKSCGLNHELLKQILKRF